LINYDGGVSDQLGLTEGYRARSRFGNPCPIAMPLVNKIEIKCSERLIWPLLQIA